MSSAAKFFRQAQARDIVYRISQYRTIANSGPTKMQMGVIPSGDSASLPPKPKKFIAGQSVAGGNEVAG